MVGTQFHVSKEQGSLSFQITGNQFVPYTFTAETVGHSYFHVNIFPINLLTGGDGGRTVTRVRAEPGGCSLSLSLVL